MEVDAATIKDTMHTIGGGLAVTIYDTIKKGIEDNKDAFKHANGSADMKAYHLMNSPDFKAFSDCFDEEGFIKIQ
jgi:hypothetical protein